MSTISTPAPSAGGPPARSAPAEPLPVLRIRSGRGWQAIDLAELWRYRELLGILALRDIKIRYKQTILGAAWAVIQPFMTMIVFTVLFSLLMDRPPGIPGIPYAVSTFCGLLPWQLFASAMTQSGNSLVANQSLISKVYFPRLIVPLSSVLAGLVDFAVGFAFLVIMMICWRITPGWGIVLLPLFMLLALASALAVGLWLSGLNAIYRDFRYTIPFMVQAGMFLTPVVYTTQSIFAKLPGILPAWAIPWVKVLYSLNPMAGVVEGFRWALLPGASAPSATIVISSLMVVLTLIGGAYYFRRIEKTIADVV